MARRRPSLLRSAAAMPPSVVIPGVAMATSHALDRLGRPEISSSTVGFALRAWRDIAASSLEELSGAGNDWVEIVGPVHREELERALRALPRHHGARLRATVEAADEDFRAKTVPNLHADPARPWWWRRCGY